MRIRPNQEMPNQIFDSQTSSKYCERINNQTENININKKYEANWFGYLWVLYDCVID